jgi:hypothetical protein
MLPGGVRLQTPFEKMERSPLTQVYHTCLGVQC